MSNEVLDLLRTHFNYAPSYLVASTPSDVTAVDPGVASIGVITPASTSSAALKAPGDRETSAAPEKVQVQITSEPPGADIFVDDAFVGSTPSKVPLAVGERTVRVTRSGFAEWRRKVRIEASSVLTLNAVLEKMND